MILILLEQVSPPKLTTGLRRNELPGLYVFNNRNASLSKFFELGSLPASRSVLISPDHLFKIFSR